VAALLARGLLVGLVAGLLCFVFLRVFGEPQVDHAISVEAQVDEAKAKAAADEAKAKGMPMPQHEEEPELVSRSVQAGIGLLTGVLVYSTAFGGIFALAFGYAYGRMADLDPRSTATVLAAAGFIALYVVPNLKYPANPPSVGAPETIGLRTALYFSMIALSAAAMIACAWLRLQLVPRFGSWNAFLIAAGGYLVAVIVVALLLPPINEVPDVFPAATLWNFRIASAGAQLILWTTLGLLFGALTERAWSGQTRLTPAPRAR
jgi:hypothetical protein